MRAALIAWLLVGCGPALEPPPKTELVRAALWTMRDFRHSGWKRVRVLEDVEGLETKLPGRLTPGTDVWRVMSHDEIEQEAIDRMVSIPYLIFAIREVAGLEAVVAHIEFEHPYGGVLYLSNDGPMTCDGFDASSGAWAFTRRELCIEAAR